MKKTLFAFTINTFEQAEIIILETKIYSIKPILHFKNYLLKGLGSDFIINFQNMLINKYGKSSFKFYVDCGFDISLSINMATNKIHFIKLNGNSNILSKVHIIASKNRVLLNPSFNIIDCRNRKKINLKIKKLYLKDKYED